MFRVILMIATPSSLWPPFADARQERHGTDEDTFFEAPAMFSTRHSHEHRGTSQSSQPSRKRSDTAITAMTIDRHLFQPMNAD